MKFTKMHGLGNDFVLCEDLPTAHNLATLAKKICNRHRGVGADGLVFLLPSTQADVRMRIINADGSEAEQCGNAVRCVAKYAYESGRVQKKQLTIETKAGLQKVWLETSNGEVTKIRVDMGEPILEADQIPVRGNGKLIKQPIEVEGKTFQFTAVSMGNPHIVIEVENAEQFAVEQWGPLLEQHPLFPARTNVEFITIHSPNELTMRVWERGVGQTLACGSGACATAVAGVLLEKTDRQVQVHLAGGELLIDWSERDNHVYMTGPATTVFTGQSQDLF